MKHFGSSDDDIDVLIRTFRVHEEEYVCNDYLQHGYECPSLHSLMIGSQEVSLEYQSLRSIVIKDWREEMCEWSYNVVDHCDIGREVVFISMSMLDRLLSKYRCNKIQYKLAAMTTLFLAIKLNSKKKIKAKSFADLSCGYFSSQHIESMERLILDGLSWKVNPPMPSTFAYYMLSLLQPIASQTEIESIRDISFYLIELSVCDYYFVTIKQSLTGIASVLSAIEIHRSSLCLEIEILTSTYLIKLLKIKSARTSDISTIKLIASRLKRMYLQSVDSCSSFQEEHLSDIRSPKCISSNYVTYDLDHKQHHA